MLESVPQVMIGMPFCSPIQTLPPSTPPWQRSGYWKAPDSSTSIAPNVEHTCIQAFAAFVSWGLPGPMPSLKRVSIATFMGVNSDHSGTSKFPQSLVPYQNSLTTIIFNVLSSERSNTSSLCRFYESCPHLTRVELAFRCWQFTINPNWGFYRIHQRDRSPR